VLLENEEVFEATVMKIIEASGEAAPAQGGRL